MKIEINNRRKTRKFTNTWKLNNALLYNLWIKENIKGEIKSILRKMKMERIYQNLWDIAKATLRGKFIAINTYIRNKKDVKQLNSMS